MIKYFIRFFLLIYCSNALSLGTLVEGVDIGGIWMPTAIGPDGERNQRYPAVMPYLQNIKTGIENYRKNYVAEVDDNSRSCLPYGMPRQMMGRAQYPIEVIQTPGQITVLTELHNDVRRIYLDGRKKPEGWLPSWMGFSLGEWKGDELIVVTTGTREKGYPNPQSLALIITERFRLVESDSAGQMLELELTLNDPNVYSSPLVVRNYFRRYADVQMGEYFCGEDLWRQNLDSREDDIPWR